MLGFVRPIALLVKFPHPNSIKVDIKQILNTIEMLFNIVIIIKLLVELGGIEPPSVSTLQKVLHV